VLAHRAPLPLAHIRPPAPPILRASAALLETSPFGVDGHRCSAPNAPMSLGAHALPGLTQQAPGIQRASDRPRLRGRAARLVRRISVANLADRAHPLVLERVAQR